MSPILEVQYWTLDRIVLYERKLRKNDHAVDRMIENLTEFGFRIPVLVSSDGECIDGDLRLKAARKIGMETVPVVVVDDWTPAQIRAFRLAANRSATWAEFDMEVVALEIRELKGLNFNLKLTGFTPLEMDRMLFQKTEPTSDLLQSPDGPAVTKPGDLWICGTHRVLCGDSTSTVDVARLFQYASPVLLVSDPPYGVSLDPDWREEAGLGKQRQVGKVTNDHTVDWSPALGLFPGDVIYVWHAGVFAGEVAASLTSLGFLIRAQLVWVKQNHAIGRGDFHWKHEPCYYCVRKGKPSNWSGDRTQSTVWQVPNLNPFGGDRQEEATGHGAQKPLELMRRPILNNSRVGEAVYDPFLGSGTTLIAAQLTERVCLAVEIEPRYVDMSIRRWQKFTGKQATLAQDGRKFDQIAAEGHVKEEV